MRPRSGSASFAGTGSAASSPESCGSCERRSTTPTTAPSERTSSTRANSRRCGFPECQKTAKRGGLCISHGGGKKCSVDGCTTSVVSRGFCVAHGGGKRCQFPGCTKSAQTGGRCWIHGGGKKCGYLGCKKRAQSGGACISHGGGKRCRMDGCNKVVQYDGLCVGHGGYRKCLSLNCDKRALANGNCPFHGGNSLCRVVNCRKRAGRGGMCAEHKSEMSLRIAISSMTFAHSRPSLEVSSQEVQFKAEPSATCTPSDLNFAMDGRSASTDVISPLQYVHKSSDATMVDQKTINLPVLPGFKTLQSNRHYDEQSGVKWSSFTGMSEQRPHFGVKHETCPDEIAISLGTTCNHGKCCVASCLRHAERNGLCLMHNIVSGPQ